MRSSSEGHDICKWKNRGYQGPVTSVTMSRILDGIFPIAHLLEIANLGGGFFLMWGLKESEH